MPLDEARSPCSVAGKGSGSLAEEGAVPRRNLRLILLPVSTNSCLARILSLLCFPSPFPLFLPLPSLGLGTVTFKSEESGSW